MKDFFLALRSYTLVYGFVKQNKIWVFYYLPLLLNTSLYFLYFYLLSQFTDLAEDFVLRLFQIHEDENVFISSFVHILFFIFNQLIILFSFQYISLVVLAPLYSILSENVLNTINSSTRLFTAKQFIKDIVRGLGVGLFGVVVQIVSIVLFSIVAFLLPPIAPLCVLIVYLISCYLYGAAMLDYKNEYYCFSIKLSIRILLNDFWYCVGIGFVFQTLFLVPIIGGIIGVLLGPSFSIVAAILGKEGFGKCDIE